jgi:hypothetical protein
MTKRNALLLFMLFLACATLVPGQSISPLPKKKIVEYGSKVSPAQLQANIRAMDTGLLDGTAVALPAEAGGGNVFDVARWAGTTPEAREQQLKILAEIPKTAKLKENFLMVYGASTMDWFSDADWVEVVANVRYCAKAAKIAGFKGIVWDGERYSGRNPFLYTEQPGYEKRSFADYERMARKRGAQFVRALEAEFPGLLILTCRLLSDFQDGSPFSVHLLQLGDQATQAAVLEKSEWGLHPAFLNGLLEGASPEVRIVDGNEDAYYYTSTLDFYKAYQMMRRAALVLVAPELRQKYDTQLLVGHAISVDYPAGHWSRLRQFPDYLRMQGQELTPEQRAQWFEHNVYYSLATADEYAWLYGPRVNWSTGERVPPGFREALVSARRKFEAGEPLGFDVKEMLEKVQQRIKASHTPKP